MICAEGNRTVVRSRSVSAAPVLDMSGDPADRPIYVMWTSGSTGEPKAVLVAHRGVTRLIREREFMDIGPRDRLVFASNAMFDAATWEIWASLANGAALVVISSEDLVDARRLRSRFERTGVTCAFVTTSLFNHLVRSDPTMFGALTSVAVGGEPLHPSVMHSVLESGAPPARLINVYGPTECTTYSTWSLIERVPTDALRIPIGGPFIETELAVVDADGRPIHGGEEGELWIAGTGVALGYLGAPPENARFVDTTLDGHRGERWFRTGDLVRRLPDGALDCLGRIDRQVKVHGYRIEPGEIEAAITEHPGVAAAAVVAVRSGSTVSLTGFLVATDPTTVSGSIGIDDNADAEIDPEVILRALRRSLPHYMVPARLMMVDHLPITANGKLDEERLRSLVRGLPVEQEVDAPPVTDPFVEPVEEFVLESARAVIGDPRLGAHDDLWAAGLDSLSAIELLDTINGGDYGRFDTPEFVGLATVAQMARVLREAPVGTGVGTPTSSVVTLNPGGIAPAVFAIPGMGGTSARFTHVARGLGPDQPVMVIGPSGMHRPGPVHRTIEEMAEHVCAEIGARRGDGEVCVLLGYSAGGTVAHEAARRLQERGVTVRLVLLDAVPGVAGGEELARVRPSAASAAGSAEPPSMLVRLRRLGIRGSLRRLAAKLRRARIERRVARFMVDPGPPSFELERYEAFSRIQRSAVERYTPVRSDLRATLIRVDDGPLEDLCAPLFEHLDVHVVGGDHLTMLGATHAPEVVTILRSIIDRDE